jgi:hypothetical protein
MDIIRRNNSSFVISKHRLELSHDSDWENVRILDDVPSYNKRLISEIIHTKRQNAGLNS